MTFTTKLFFCIYIFFTFSCSSISYNQIIPLARDAVIGNKVEISEEFIARQKYSFIKLNFKKYDSILVLSRINPDNSFRWVSANGEVIETLDGRIIRTEKCFENLQILSLPVYNSDQHYLIHFKTSNVFLEQSIEPLEKDYSFLREKVNTVNSQLKWSFINEYYYDNYGRPIKTSQYLIPNQGRISINYFYK